MRAFLGKHDRLVHGLRIWYPKSGIAERSALFPFEQEVPWYGDVTESHYPTFVDIIRSISLNKSQKEDSLDFLHHLPLPILIGCKSVCMGNIVNLLSFRRQSSWSPKVARYLLEWSIESYLNKSMSMAITKVKGDANYFFVRGTIFCLYVISSVYLSLRVRNCMYYCVDKHKLAQVIAECFVGMTLPISAFHAWEHLTNFVRPRLQSQIVRIIWMVPIYSFESLLSIMYMEYAVYFQAIREIYEAYVIYCFMRWDAYFGKWSNVLLVKCEQLLV